jgi:hypothetical protein
MAWNLFGGQITQHNDRYSQNMKSGTTGQFSGNGIGSYGGKDYYVEGNFIRKYGSGTVVAQLDGNTVRDTFSNVIAYYDGSNQDALSVFMKYK